MGAVDKGKLDSKVADDLLMDSSVVQLMENPKVASAITRLKDDPGSFAQMCADDPELGDLFSQLKEKMDKTEGDRAAAEKDAPPVRKPSLTDDDAPPLQDATAASAEQARAEGGACFAREDYAGAVRHYERCVALTPRDPPAWTNLAVSLLRLGRAAAALEAAQKAVALEPRFAKGWLRQGEAQAELGKGSDAIASFEAGLLRAEGSARLALTRALQRAREVQRSAEQEVERQRAAERAARAASATATAAAPVASSEAVQRYAEAARQQTVRSAQARRAPAPAPGGAVASADADAPAPVATVATGFRKVQIALDDDEEEEQEALEEAAAVRTSVGAAADGEAGPAPPLLSNEYIFDLE